MLKKLCALTLSLLMFQLAFARPAAAAQGDARAAKVRAEVAGLGTGERARVKVELLDGRKLEGHVTAAGEDGFVVADGRGEATRLGYDQVKRLRGRNLSTGAKVGIGVGVGAGLALLVAYVAWAAAER